MKKKLLSLLLMAIMIMNTLLLTACGGGGGQEVTEDNVAYNGEAVTIKFVHTMGAANQAILDKYIEKFNEIYPNITVVHESGGDYDDVRDNTLNQLNVGEEPNIVYCYPDHVALYIMAGAAQPLDAFINSQNKVGGSDEIIGLTQAQKDAFIQGFYNEGAAFGDGKMYTMPFSKSTEVLYYNIEFFEEHNLELPETWDDMAALCEQIKAIDPDCIPLGYDSEANLFITMCEQLGSPYTSATGNRYLFNNDTNKGFVEMFRQWYQKGWLTTKTLYGNYTSGLFTNIPNAENPVRSYMSIGSSGGAQHQAPAKDTAGNDPFTVGIAPIPHAAGKDAKVISQGPSVTIFKKSNPTEVVASWLFVKFLTTSVDFQAEYSVQSGYMPVLKEEVINQNQVYAKFLANADKGNAYLTALSVKVSLAQKDSYFVSPAFNGSSVARDQVGALMINMLALQGSTADVKSKMDQAFKDAVDVCEYKS